MPDFIHIHPCDNVVVALRAVPAGTAYEGITARVDIPQGHKMAIEPIAEKEPVTKYGFSIGHATAPIAAGEWVHTHNMTTNLSGEMEYTYAPNIQFPEPMKPGTFRGYRRGNGRVGVRNEIWIIPTVGCVNSIAQRLVRENQHLVGGTVDGLYTFPHPFGCSQMGDDHAQTRKLLAALVRHPNAGGVLVLGLGCENLTMDQFKEELGEWDSERVKFLVCQEEQDEIAAGAALAGMKSLAAMKHVGLNVAADPLFTAAYIGLPGGLVVLSADDPGCHSSQNEQDNRGYLL